MIREARRTQNSKQDKIQVVKSQPSVNSLREGQEVIYLSKTNRLERYRKEQGRLWTSYILIIIIMLQIQIKIMYLGVQ